MPAPPYRLLWLEIAERQYLDLPDDARRLVDERLTQLERDPFGLPGAVYDASSDQWSAPLGGGLVLYAVVTEPATVICVSSFCEQTPSRPTIPYGHAPRDDPHAGWTRSTSVTASIGVGRRAGPHRWTVSSVDGSAAGPLAGASRQSQGGSHANAQRRMMAS